MSISFKKDINRKGLSLVEVMIACVLIVILLLPVFTLQKKGNRNTMQNKYEILAQTYASNYIAYCNALPFNDPILKESLTEIDTESDTGKTFLEAVKTDLGLSQIDVKMNKNIFKRTLTVKDIAIKDSSWPYKYKLVTVKVSWQQPGEREKSISMKSLLSSFIK